MQLEPGSFLKVSSKKYLQQQMFLGMEMKASSPQRLNICMLLSDLYDPNMPARPAVREIYGNCFPNMGYQVTWIVPAKENTKEIQEKSFGDVRIFTIPYNIGPSFPKKVFAKLVFLWKERRLASRIIQREDCNVIQVRNRIFEGLLAIYLKRKYKIPFVFQYSFPLIESEQKRHELNLDKLFPLQGRVSSFGLSYILHKADLILPISQWMQDDLVSKGIPREKMMPLPLAVNSQLFSPLTDGEDIRQKHNLSNSIVIIYLGVMDRGRQLEILIHSLAQLKPRKPNIKLLMVGEGTGRDDLTKLACHLELQDRLIFTGQVPYFEVPRYIATADVALSVVPPLDTFKVSSPCKLFEYMAMAKPVIANKEIPEHKEVLEQSEGGILVPFTPEAFAQAIIELLDNPDKAAEMGRRGREWVLENRTYEILARQVEKRYFQLLADR